jgi:LuxR family maltose regulon positive regulatory protein
LVLLTAPPGYGKTTLVAQFASQTSHFVAWHTVEERERDVPNLYAHSIAALSDFVPALKSSTPPKGATPNELASIVTDALRTTASRALVYILDDIHHLIGSPGSEAWLRSFVANFPSSCQLILIRLC